MEQKIKVKQYLLIARIGQGAFGTVYKGVLATDPNRVFAVKAFERAILDADDYLTRLFKTEVAIMSCFDHPNLVKLHEVLETPETYYLVLGYCNNGDLESYLKLHGGRLPEMECIYFLMQIANGFRILHKQKIMHRDVKLANLFLDDDRVVIGDFGIAKQGAEVAQTKLGTPMTMAPEVLANSHTAYTSKADLWSIGVCFYQMLFGRRPFDPKSFYQLDLHDIQRNSGEKLNFPENIPVSAACTDLLIRLIEFDPVKRIEWRDFFNHKVFLDFEQMKAQNSNQFGKIFLTQKLTDSVTKEFNRHRQTIPDQLVQSHLETLKKNLITKNVDEKKEEEQLYEHKEDELTGLTRTYKENFQSLKERYKEEVVKADLVEDASFKMELLIMKIRQSHPELTDDLIFGAWLLRSKALRIRSYLFKSLNNKRNIFRVKDFDKFVSEKDKNFQYVWKMCGQNFEELHKLSLDCLHRLENQVFSEKIHQEIDRLGELEYRDGDKLDAAMIELLRHLKTKLPKLEGHKKIEKDFCISLLYLYFAAFSDRVVTSDETEQTLSKKTLNAMRKRGKAKEFIVSLKI